MSNKKIDKKCAPSKKYTNGSCFSTQSLKNIATNYNKRNKNKINIDLPKEELVKELENKLSDKCSDQTCWLRQDFVKEMNNEEILKNTFRPSGPSKKYEWLSTTHIDDVVQQYQNVHKDFLFLGAVPYDFEDLHFLGIHNINFKELENQNKSKIGMVINLDTHDLDGSHWVALYTDLKKNQIYFFDSVGKVPEYRIRKFINKIAKYIYQKKYNSRLPINDILKKIKNNKNNKYDKIIQNIKDFDIRYNNIQHQFKNSECGVYSINFIVRLVSGESFDSIINNITKDDEMNENRKIYFRNVN